MQETLTTIQNDSSMVLIAGIALVVLLAIVLVVVVSSMRVKGYKDRFQNLLIEIKEKSTYINSLEKEAEVSSVEQAKNKKELLLFDETKQTLVKSKDKHKALQKEFDGTKKESNKVKTTLKSLKIKHETLIKSHENLEEKLEISLEENNKLKANNARLLSKLEKEVAKALEEHGKKE
ncbi:MAG TPA: hypothetical protein EYG82_02675 [Sulfurovum sp.]|nr:hypothetical protein [Sulfurovum sp.]